MSEKLYSADDVAEILGLHVRTVRGYVRDGRLKAVRIGKQYRIAEPDLREFTGGASPPSATVPPEVTVTAIMQIERAGRRLRDRISTHAVAAAGAGGVEVHAVYDEPRDSLKVIVVGEAADTATMITLVDAIARGGAQ